MLGLVLRYFGQPSVIGEMAAGIVLGPVVFGAVAPELHAHVFEQAASARSAACRSSGLVLFMFIVGAELRLPHGARKQIVAAAGSACCRCCVPMALGLRVAVPLHDGWRRPA